LFTGATHDTVAVDAPGPVTADAPVGASGTVLGVTAADGALGTEEPFAEFATTVIVYGVPLVRPVIVQVVASTPRTGVTEHCLPPGLAVAV
jgi:hypothetical protein